MTKNYNGKTTNLSKERHPSLPHKIHPLKPQAQLAMDSLNQNADWNNDTSYWDFMAKDYNGEILSSCHEDKSGNVRRILNT